MDASLGWVEGCQGNASLRACALPKRPTSGAHPLSLAFLVVQCMSKELALVSFMKQDHMHFDETTQEYVFSPSEAKGIGLEFEPATPEVRRVVDYTRLLLARADILGTEAEKIDYTNDVPGERRAALKHRKQDLLILSTDLRKLIAPHLPMTLMEDVAAGAEAFLSERAANSE